MKNRAMSNESLIVGIEHCCAVVTSNNFFQCHFVSINMVHLIKLSTMILTRTCFSAVMRLRPMMSLNTKATENVSVLSSKFHALCRIQ